MRHYQCKKNNPYHLPHNLYMRMLYLIRDYSRLQEERMDIILSGGAGDGQPRASTPGNPTESKALRLLKTSDHCNAVESALKEIPKEYRRGVFNNICYGSVFPDDAAYSTYKRWRQRFIYNVALKLGEV